jgi:predicted lipid-binding transport protein (Tim44 family)
VRSIARATIFALVLAIGATAEARPGGGGSFSGGSSGGGGGSFGGGSSGASRPISGGNDNDMPRSPDFPSMPQDPSPIGMDRPPRDTPSVWVYRVSDRPPPDHVKSNANGVDPYGYTPARSPSWPQPIELHEDGVSPFTLMVGAVFVFIVGVFVWMVVSSRRRVHVAGWSTQRTPETSTVAPVAPVAITMPQRADLRPIARTDPDFSTSLFEDFVYALYAEAQTARGAGTLDLLAPYIRASARESLLRRGTAEVSTVIVGAMRVFEFTTVDARHRVGVELEANYTEGTGPNEQSYWVVERWFFSRATSARSRPPARVRTFGCPSCGAPIEKLVGSACRYCNRVVDTGDFDWIVDSIVRLRSEPRGPMLTGTTEERGTELPTIFERDLATELAALKSRDATFDEQALRGRIAAVFDTMQVAWSSLEWERARPFLTDNLFESQRYWIEAYRREGLRNVTERTHIRHVEIARVAQDRWFDSITVRVHAVGLDYTLRDRDGAVVGGSRVEARMYTEYWTLIRSVSAKRAADAKPACPSCGAPLDAGMAAVCKSCNAKVTSADFDWVLARIEQDEVYTG